MITDRKLGQIIWFITNTVLLYIISFILLYPFTTPSTPLRAIYPETPYIFFKLAAYIMVMVLVVIMVQFTIVLLNVDDKHFTQPTKRNFTEPS